MPDERSDRNRLLAFSFRLGLGLLALVLAGGVFYGLYRTRPTIQQTDPAAVRPTVNVFVAEPVEVQRQWTGYGTVQAVRSVEIMPRVTAPVASIPDAVEAGRRVTAGQVLVQLDEEDFVRQLEIARQRIAEIDAAFEQLAVEESLLEERLSLADTEVSIAQTDYDRQVSLRERNVNNAANVDAAQRTLISAKQSRLQILEAQRSIGPRRSSLLAQRASQSAEVNLAELNRQRTTITSPIDGVIQSLDVEVGESLMTGQQRIARVVAIDHIEVPLSLPAAARGRVEVGDRAVLMPTGPLSARLPMPGWTTAITRIAPEADAATRTFTVFVELEASGHEIRLPAPGMFLRATVFDHAPETRLVVPRSAVSGERIQVVRDGKIASLPAEIAFDVAAEYPQLGVAANQWSVLDDPPFDAGELVLISSATPLPDGTPVHVRLPTGSTTPVSPPSLSTVVGSDPPPADTSAPAAGDAP